MTGVNWCKSRNALTVRQFQCRLVERAYLDPSCMSHQVPHKTAAYVYGKDKHMVSVGPPLSQSARRNVKSAKRTTFLQVTVPLRSDSSGAHNNRFSMMAYENSAPFVHMWDCSTLGRPLPRRGLSHLFAWTMALLQGSARSVGIVGPAPVPPVAVLGRGSG